ncbi:MAG: sodium:solute symporter [Proteobacteria bacterium]|nr:MAG: sodium:solute symporter [Pseudomonadota bacterium]
MPSTPALATVDITIIVGFFVSVTLIGWVMSKRASQGLDDYFLGGNTIPWWILGISTATSNFDMSGTMINLALVFALGYRGFLVEIRGGVGLSLSFLMVFLGKWLRRSRVMTSAEWMKLRFGTDRPGQMAHLLSAVANVVLSLGMIIYFSKGSGKFLTSFIPLSELTCIALMVGIGLFYTLLSGLYGVVFTDVVQMLLLTLTAIYVTVKAFALRPAVELPAGLLSLGVDRPADLGQSLLRSNPGAWGPIFNAFGVCLAMWFFRTTLEGCGGVGGYTDQRFFAARSEREANLLTAESIVLSVFRWTMIAGLVVFGYDLLAKGGPAAAKIAKDAEYVLPVVLQTLFPAGIKGFVVAGLIAAAMSTFDSTLNAGAAYIVKDVYASYINPNAEGKTLMAVSRWATVGLCVGGIGLAALIPNINTIWGLVTMGIGAGMFVPLFLRWYWPRFNGYGFAAGTGAGIVAALIVNAGLALPLYTAFPAIVGSAFVVVTLATLTTPPVDDEILVRFWTQVGPWGLWGRVKRLTVERGQLSEEDITGRNKEHRQDALAMAGALPFQLSVLITAMSFVWHDWGKVKLFGGLTVVSVVLLYLLWYRNLKSEDLCTIEDERFADPLGEGT